MVSHGRQITHDENQILQCKHTGENRDHISILGPVVTLHYQLVRPCHQSQAIVVIECLRNILPECVSSTTGRDTPAASVVGVTPQKVAHGTLVRDLLNPIQRADVVEGVNRRTQTAVQTEDLVLDKCGEGEVVEKVGEVFPHVSVAVLAQALIVEAVDLRDLARLVVSSQDGDTLGVTDFEADKERDGLYRVVTTVDVVT